MMRRRGFTLIELIVSMGLFTILSTIVIVSFVTFANIQARTAAMKDSQQKLRTTLDQMIRQTKEAVSIGIVNNTAEVSITLNYNTPPTKVAKYTISKRYKKLYYQECNIVSTTSVYVPCSDIASAPIQDVLASYGNGSGRVFLDTALSNICWNSPKNVPDACATAINDSNNLAPSIKISLVGKIDYGSNKYYNDENFTLGTTVALERAVGAAGLVSNTFDVTFDEWGGSPQMTNLVDVIAGTTIIAPATPPTKTGYIFGGWYKQSDFVDDWDFAVDRVVEDTWLYAKWINYKLDYWDSGRPVPPTVTGINLRVSPVVPTRLGYTFVSWNTKWDGTGVSYSPDGMITLSANTVLYARWVAN